MQKKSRLKLKQQHRKKVIYPVERGLNSEESRKLYRFHFDTFLKWVGLRYSVITPERLLEIKPSQLESLIIEYLNEHMHKQKGLKHSTIRTAMAAILHFLDMNDILLNRRKITKLAIPPDEGHVSDLAYTRNQIQKLLDTSDARFKMIILLLANGMRIGALPVLQLGDLTEIKLLDQPKIYKIWVYNRSKKDRYYTFVTPECTKTIDDYLDYRRKQGEDITVKTSPLIREQFRLGHRVQAEKPHSMVLGTIEKTLERIIKKSGIDTLGTVMMSHGFRKWAITQMKKAKVDFSDREYLVGHKMSRGLDVSYDRTTEEERLEEWSKAINNLTINPAFHLEKELEVYKGETAQRIAELTTQLKAREERFKEFDLRMKKVEDEYEKRQKQINREVERAIYQEKKKQGLIDSC
jgi:hypothetical protein